jgi:2-methylaconitate cis-trans-isomerase PrpF
MVEKAGLLRTARILMDGIAFVPGSIFAGEVKEER